MPIALKQGTASQEVPLGHFVDDGDGKTAEISLTIANTDIKVWKTGATTLANKNSGGATHISGGIYHCTLDATDTDTVGPLVLFVAVAGALAVRLECDVLPANVFDARYGADLLQVDVQQFGNTNLTAASGIPEVRVASIAAGAIAAATFAANALDAVWSAATRLLTAGTNIALAKGTGVTGFNDLSAAQVNTEVDTALSDYDGPTQTELTAAVAAGDDATLSAIAALNNLSAAQVRTELSTELGRIDAAVSTRLASAGYTAPATANQNADALLARADAIETGLTPAQALRLVVAASAGKLAVSGNTVTIRNVGDTKARITATTDDNGQRTAVTTDTA